MFNSIRSTLTADLWDRHGERLESCAIQFRQFGGRTAFQGQLITVKCRHDSGILKSVISEPGEGRVLVVDGDGSLECALFGDQMAEIASSNKWEGVVINGAVRDVAKLQSIDIGIKALGSNPRRSVVSGAGKLGVPVVFGGATFISGNEMASDEDGIVVFRAPSNQSETGASNVRRP